MARRGKRERKRARQERRAERRAEATRVRFRADEAPRQTAADPITGTASAKIGTDREWYIARIEPRLGSAAIKGLADLEVRTIQPRISEIVTRAGRRIVRNRQLLLRTAFIGVRDAEHLEEARSRRGIAGIVSVPHEDATATGNVEGMVMRPARLDPVRLQGFIDRLAEKEIVEPYGVKAGDPVILLSGPFASFPGIIEKILPNDTVKVGVSIFGRATPVVLGIAEVRIVP